MKPAKIASVLLVFVLGLPLLAKADAWAESDSGMVAVRSSQADTVVKAQLLTTYALNPYLNTSPITVKVKRGTVILLGSVHDGIELYLAETIPHAINGVEKVVNNLTINPDAPRILLKDSYASKINDLNISATVVYNLQKQPTVSSYKITVTTLNGVATLIGEVNTFEQKEIAGKVATKTPGVLMVTNNLKVVSNT